MLRRLPLAAFALGLTLVVTACGSSSSPNGLAGNGSGGPGPLPFGGSPTLIHDPDHHYRVVNLHSYNSGPGAAVDIFPVNQSDLAELPGIAPLVSGLAYGQVSDPLQPGATSSAADTPHYSLGVLPHSPNDPGSSNLKLDIYDSNNGQAWHQGLVVLGGTGNGLQAQTFYDTTPASGTNGVPAVVPGSVSLLVDTQHAGDPEGPQPVSALVVGASGHCLKATNDGRQGPASPLVDMRDSFFTLPAGTASLDFWAGSACAGAPTFTVALPASLSAGSRAALFVYGPDAGHLSGVVAPIDN
jgi:hypothetical protein